MKKRIIFVTVTLGWILLMLALLMLGIRSAGLDPEYYFRLQMAANVPETAGIAEEDLLMLDGKLADYLRGRLENPNAEIEVYGELQPAFNERELIHLDDCRKLFAPVVDPLLNVFLFAAGAAPVFCGRTRNYILPAWIAAAVIILPLAVFGIRAAVDFNSAFVFFHRLLFTNDLWLLDPCTDLLIRICPSSMFASLGLRIGLYSAGFLLGLPLLYTVLHRISEKRKKANHEIPQI